jgi:hypothetical protein
MARQSLPDNSCPSVCAVTRAVFMPTTSIEPQTSPLTRQNRILSLNKKTSSLGIFCRKSSYTCYFVDFRQAIIPTAQTGCQGRVSRSAPATLDPDPKALPRAVSYVTETLMCLGTRRRVCSWTLLATQDATFKTVNADGAAMGRGGMSREVGDSAQSR